MDLSEPVDDLSEVVEEYEEDFNCKEEVPTKCVPTVQNFLINCIIRFIDFEGKTDGENNIKLTAQLKPRRIMVRCGGLVGDSSILDYNAWAALVSQYGPIDNKNQNSGLITSYKSLFAVRPFALRPFQTTKLETFVLLWLPNPTTFLCP
jgi:hypothetical protein